MHRHVQLMEDNFGTRAHSMVYFPCATGFPVEKEAAVQSIVFFVHESGGTVTSPSGERLYGGHSMHMGGAVLLCSMGLDLHKIQVLGLWKSAIIERYVRLAPVRNLARDVIAADMRTVREEFICSTQNAQDVIKQYSKLQKAFEHGLDRIHWPL